MERDSCLGPEVDCYSAAPIVVGANSTVSQRAYLCAASHDFRQPNFPLIVGPITIRSNVWVAAEAFIGPGVTIEDHAVVGARAVVTRDVPSEAIVAGNPARIVGSRT